MGLFDRFKKMPAPGDIFPTSQDQKPFLPTITKSADLLIPELEHLEYFTYVDPVYLPQLKAELGKGLAEEHYFPFVESGSPKYEALDPRQFILDNETLFEQGGIVEALEEMAQLFAKMNIRMEISHHVEKYDKQKGLDHRITLNGKPYIVFHQWNGYGWGESAQRFADIVNDQFAIQNSTERLYLIQGANDGRAVFLSPEQYALVRPLINNLNECPLPAQEWCKVMGVAWKNVIS